MSREVEDEIRKTLASIQRTAAETEQISSATATLVDAQGEQIDNTARHAETIASNLSTSDWLIRGLQGWKGRLANVFSGPDNGPNKLPAYMPSGSVVTNDVARNMSSKEILQPQIHKTGFDQELDTNLDSISSAIGNIKARSLQLNESINKQINTVQSVEESIDKSKERIGKQHSIIKNLR